MKMILLSVLAVVLAGAVAAYLYRDAVIATAGDVLTADMFVEASAATFAVGPEVGERLPQIRAIHEGQIVTDLDRFLGTHGLVLIANRSVVW